MNREDDAFLQDPELARLGKAVSRLPREEPPPNLVARTLAHISANCQPVKRVFWLLRPITHPLARFAAAALIIAALLPMTNINMADALGSRIEHKIIGREATDRIQSAVDRLLVRHCPASYSQQDLDEFVGIPRPQFKPMRRGVVSFIGVGGV
ncbi:MAG TPA: hypothetical protein VGP72_29270 [Planctomycetota bacterium]|jgi:hypothetical protein